jgi:uncharacterized membrane protein
MGTAIVANRIDFHSAASSALNASARLWFAVAVIGQWAFLYYIAGFYGPSTFTGNFPAWNKNAFLHKAYIPGDTAGNLAFASHALLAGVIAFGGAIQLIPQIRTRAIGAHRWLGRVFMVTALGLSASGLYITWFHGAPPKSFLETLPTTLNAVLIILCVAVAWRTAVTHQIAAHRRWTLRTYLVANAQWFTRIGFVAWVVVSRSLLRVGDSHDGQFFGLWIYGCFVAPLAILELYLRAKESAGTRGRFAMAGGLVVLSLLTAIGIFGALNFFWLPLLRKS